MEKELALKEVVKQGFYLLCLTGDITKTSGEFLLTWRNWEEGLGSDIHSFILDFSKVEYINSAGIAALLRLLRSLPEERCRTGCFGLNYHYEKLFKMVGLTRYLRIYPAEQAAMEGLQEEGQDKVD